MAEEPIFRIPIDFLFDSVCEKFKLGNDADDIKAYLRKSGIDEDTISHLLERFFSEFNAQEQNDVLTDSRQQNEWYGGPKEDSNSHWVRLKEILCNKKNWTEEMIDALDSASTSVMKKIASPNSVSQFSRVHVKGLVLGYVQSGKTANYSAVISKAIDAGYKFIVVLAGIHNNLRYQTEVRLKEEIIEPNETTCITLTRTDKNGDFSKKESTSANKACGQPHGFSMAVIKKNASVLRSFNSWLSSAKQEHLESCPILIIDDESDQASINTSKDPELNPSAINGAIRKIMGHFKVASYVGYTATPFANMLVEAAIEDDLYPKDFFISLHKSPSYTGAEELFGSYDLDDRTVKPGLPIVREIDFDEANHVRQVSKPRSRESYALGDSLKEAIDGFLLACATRIARKHWNRHFSMLVHCTQKVSVQQEIFDQIEQYISDIKFSYLRNDEGLQTRLENHWNTDYSFTTKNIDPSIEVHSFEAIWTNLQNVIDHLQVVLDNSKSDKRLSYEEKFWGIVVGGNTLSRGLTLEGLMMSYFVRTSNYYDSLMQMGRWFGYRRGYLDLIRIYMTDDLKERFFHLANVENEIREEIHTMAENGDRPIDVGTRIRTHPGMTVTNAMKMRSADVSNMSFSCTKVQPTYHNITSETLEINSQAVHQLLDDIISYGGSKVDSKFTRFSDSHLFRGISPEVVLQFLDSYSISPANIRFSAERVSDYITQVVEANELRDWSVAFVSKIKASHHANLSHGVRLGLSDRSISEGLVSELDRGARYIKRVATPIDEFIDLGDLVENCPTDVDAFTQIEGVKHGIGYFRRKYRPKDRGLLLIYAINPESNLEERRVSSSPYPLVPLKAPDIVYGACFVLPETASDRGSVSYVVNRSIGRQPIKHIQPFTKPQVAKETQKETVVEKTIANDPKVIQLSKSRFQAGLQCPKRLFLECHQYDQRDEVTTAQESIFETGQKVGELAQKRFPNGKLVVFGAFHQKEANEATEKWLKDDSVESIYEAAFTHDNIKVRVDILNKLSSTEVDIVEVKSSSRVKEEHYTDLAVQAYVVEGAGLKVRKCFLMHIDSSYEYEGGKYDLEKLFALDEVTNEVKNLQDMASDRLSEMWSVIKQDDVPDVETGPHCKKPYQCSYYQFCRKDWPKDHVSTLPRASMKLVVDLTSNGITTIREIPDKYKGLTLTQQRVRESIVHNKVYCETELKSALQILEAPQFFIDFETINPALPLFKSTRPFQQLPFQWSAHIRDNGKDLRHEGFLAQGNEDPRREFIETLLNILGEQGAVLVYSSFEKTCLNAIAAKYPEYQEAIDNVCSRMTDLLALIRRHFYHPNFNGSFSIKKVLPALVPDLSYAGMEIGDGATAAMSFVKIIESSISGKEEQKVRKNLLEYCKLDTLAMVKVLDALIASDEKKGGRITANS
ncbi:MAG: Z1 domain-containing protein [Oligoflexales bacterium]